MVVKTEDNVNPYSTEGKITVHFITAFKIYRPEIKKEDFPKAFWGDQWNAISEQMYSEFVSGIWLVCCAS